MARAVGVVDNATFPNTLIDDILVSVVLDRYDCIVKVIQQVRVSIYLSGFSYAPSQRGGAQDEEGCFNLVHVLILHLVLHIIYQKPHLQDFECLDVENYWLLPR